MRIVFVGGGSFRILPIVRAICRHGPALREGEIRLVDRLLPRAEAVGRVLEQTPEVRAGGVRVSWSDDLDRALDGADALYVTMAVGSAESFYLAARESMRRGFIASDQLSLTGGFLSLIAGPAILGFARRMERLCPAAPMLIFANPVAVYSGLVGNHTRIQALGLCGGASNHRWDLTRLMGRDEYVEDYEVDVAGINHLSFILRGRFHGEDLYAVLGRHLRTPYRPPRITSNPSPYQRASIRFSLRKLAEMYHRFGRIIYSTEGDGIMHLFYEEMFARSLVYHQRHVPQTLPAMRRTAAAGAARREEASRQLAQFSAAAATAGFWDRGPGASHPWLAPAEHDLAVPLVHALAGHAPLKFAASRPHQGAVAGFKPRTVLEYSLQLDRNGLRPVPDLAVPDPFHGLISSLATFQTLLGDAVGTQDPRLLADALFSYPVRQNSRDARALHRALLRIYADQIPAWCQRAADYL